MTIEPQKDGESLKDRVNDSEENSEALEAVKEIIESLPLVEEEVGEVEGGEEDEKEEEVEAPGSREAYQEILRDEKGEESPELVEVYPSTEPESEYEEPESAPVGPSDYKDEFYVSPQVLEEAHSFLNKYGIMTDKLSPKEVMTKIEKIQEAKEESMQVLSRGRAIDGINRLLSFVPEGFIGEFKRENDIDISRAKALGFTVLVSDEAKVESSTGKSDGLVRFGDQIMMIIPEEKHVGNRLAKAERLAKRRAARSFKDGASIDQGSADPLFPLIKL